MDRETPLSELIGPYKASLEAKKRQPRGVARYLWSLNRFVVWVGEGRTMAAVDERCVLRWQEQLAQHAASTIGNSLCVVRSFCRWGQREGLRDDDPTARIEWPTKKRPLPRSLKPAETRQLVALIALPLMLDGEAAWTWQRNRRCILLMLYAGLRLAEVAALEWAAIDLDGGEIRVYEGKGGKDRALPIAPPLRDALEAVLPDERAGAVAGRHDGSCYTYRAIENVFRRWLREQLGQPYSAHQLRHTFATTLLKRRANIRVIQELLGHERLETTQRYLRVDTELMQQAVDLLPGINDW